MKSGTCPKCGGRNIHGGFPGAIAIPVSAFSGAGTEVWICTDCGYLESWVKDSEKLDRIAEKWPRLRPAEEG